mmetsp:Transcript_11140/g.18172  ORF Transcript_11140/g.18172 Transcript_11140/m.18172 type:complete len:81 (+) Transcript_11140:1-243(+)
MRRMKAYFAALCKKKNMQKLFEEMDNDGNECLDKEEFIVSFAEVISKRCGDDSMKLIQRMVFEETEPLVVRIYYKDALRK